MKACIAAATIPLILSAAGCALECDNDSPCHSEAIGPGIIRITPYVPGEISAPGGGEVFVQIDQESPKPEEAEASASSSPLSLNIVLDDACLFEVVQEVANIADANIIASQPQLRGRVTANLEDIDWHSALATILDMNNLALIESPPGSKIYRIDPVVPGAPEPMKTKVYHLNSPHETAEVANALERTMGPGTGFSIGAVPSRNCIIVNATASYHGIIADIMAELNSQAEDTE